MAPVSSSPSTSSPGPSPQASSQPLKTIVTVKSSAYCTALGLHFNGAYQPMHYNDVTIARAGVALDDINTLFSKPDYVNRFVAVRANLTKHVGMLLDSLPHEQDEINKLREGEKVAPDPQAAQQMHDTADQLQRAWDKQHQLAIDLQGIVQSMMQYNIFADQPLGANDIQNATLPADMKDIKSYLRFNGQRQAIADAEANAVDIAYDIATNRCSAP
ncbi:MAG: hypothetical protein ACLQPV_08320 [Vulcanimicrobiaceae bacterium]